MLRTGNGFLRIDEFPTNLLILSQGGDDFLTNVDGLVHDRSALIIIGDSHLNSLGVPIRVPGGFNIEPSVERG
ncbi:hypothetical protein D3C78_1721120 [compost metagenome]